MAEKQKNVFEKLQESLDTVAEEIHMANDALYVVATEAMDLSEQLSNVNAKLDKILNISIEETSNTKASELTETNKSKIAITAPSTTLEFPKGKEVKK